MCGITRTDAAGAHELTGIVDLTRGEDHPTAHDNALTLGPRPGAFIAPASMRGGKIVHPLAHRPMITQRFHPARRAGAAIR